MIGAMARIFDSLAFNITGTLLALKLAGVGSVSWLLVAAPVLVAIPASIFAAMLHNALQKAREER